MQSSKTTKQSRKKVTETAPAEKSPATESTSTTRKARSSQSDKGFSEPASQAAAMSHRKTSTTRAKAAAAAVGSAGLPVTSSLSGPVAEANQPSYEEIAKRAYYYWLERGGESGDPSEDWLRAERELSAAR